MSMTHQENVDQKVLETCMKRTIQNVKDLKAFAEALLKKDVETAIKRIHEGVDNLTEGLRACIKLQVADVKAFATNVLKGDQQTCVLDGLKFVEHLDEFKEVLASQDMLSIVAKASEYIDTGKEMA